MDRPDVIKWDPKFTRRVKELVDPLLNAWYRPKVHGIRNIPAAGAALVVSNHSGGMLTPDMFVLGQAFYDAYGYDRPMSILAHFGVLLGPTSGYLERLGAIKASPENAAAALRAGSVVLVFPGGDYDVYRPTAKQNTIDFDGRTGYVRTAVEAGVPIVPTVSIGPQEGQLFLARSPGLAKLLRLDKFRMKIVPISFGFPFGLSVLLPANIPLPTKVVTEVLAPIDIVARFGPDPDIAEVDEHIRATMQIALDSLAGERRFPLLG